MGLIQPIVLFNRSHTAAILFPLLQPMPVHQAVTFEIPHLKSHSIHLKYYGNLHVYKNNKINQTTKQQHNCKQAPFTLCSECNKFNINKVVTIFLEDWIYLSIIVSPPPPRGPNNIQCIVDAFGDECRPTCRPTCTPLTNEGNRKAYR